MTAAFRGTTAKTENYDVVIVGAGVFGTWTAARLNRLGKRVAVIDAVSPAHSRASSGGESRATRFGYGASEIYSEWARDSISEWQSLSDRAGLPLFHQLGMLGIYREPSRFYADSAEILADKSIPFSRLTAAEVRARYPVMQMDDDEIGFFEPGAGALMARRAVQFLASTLAGDGVTFLTGEVSPISVAQGKDGALSAIATSRGSIEAEQFVFACGPWLDRVCPDAMRDRLFVTRQEVFYFAADPDTAGELPVWADLPFYGFPSLEGRGFKVANDTHGDQVDPNTVDRRASKTGEAAAREFLARRFPSFADATLVETRVCQYENSSNGHFVIDRHPGLDNVWLAGCGSGHGFKHGPAVGAHVADLVAGRAQPRAPFLLSSKQARQERAVQ